MHIWQSSNIQKQRACKITFSLLSAFQYFMFWLYKETLTFDIFYTFSITYFQKLLAHFTTIQWHFRKFKTWRKLYPDHHISATILWFKIYQTKPELKRPNQFLHYINFPDKLISPKPKYIERQELQNTKEEEEEDDEKWKQKRTNTNPVCWERRATTPKIKNMRSIPECSKSFMWDGFKTPCTKNLRWVEYRSSMHISMKAPIATTYSSKYLSLPSKPETGFQTLTWKPFGFITNLTTALHMCHKPTARNSVPGSTCPLNEPIPLESKSNPSGPLSPISTVYFHRRVKAMEIWGPPWMESQCLDNESGEAQKSTFLLTH